MESFPNLIFPMKFSCSHFLQDTPKDHIKYPTSADPASRRWVFLDDGSAKLTLATHARTNSYGMWDICSSIHENISGCNSGVYYIYESGGLAYLKKNLVDVT